MFSPRRTPCAFLKTYDPVLEQCYCMDARCVELRREGHHSRLIFFWDRKAAGMFFVTLGIVVPRKVEEFSLSFWPLIATEVLPPANETCAIR